MGPRGTVTEPGSPRGSGARAAQRLEPQCGPGAPPGRSRGIHPARPAPRGCLGHSPRGQGSRATGRGHRCARLTPGAAQVLRPDPRDAAAGEGRAGGRGRRRGRAGLGLPTSAVGPWPRPGCAAPALSTPHPIPPTPGETPALKVGAAGASELWRRQQLRKLRAPPPVDPGTFSASSQPPLGHSSWSPRAPHLSSRGPAALPPLSEQRKSSFCSLA